MDTYYASLTVWFEGPFWVGVLQREDGGRLTACRHVFGAEPKEQEVYQWLLREWQHLTFSPGVPAGDRNHDRPKRRRREAQTPPAGTGTKAQQALQLQREQCKTQRRERRRLRDAAEVNSFSLTMVVFFLSFFFLFFFLLFTCEAGSTAQKLHVHTQE